MDETSLLHALTRIELASEQVSEINDGLSRIANWKSFVQQVESNGLAPLLAYHVDKHNLLVPEVVKLSLSALCLRHKAASAARYEVVKQMETMYSEVQIPFVALKGLALAHLLYPKPELRPMRDMDVLIPEAQQQQAAESLRQIGFNLPQDQPSRFMRNSHQLPNATKNVNGFTVSVELHRDSFADDIKGHLKYSDVADECRVVQWHEVEFLVMGHEHMLYQLFQHLSGLHPGGFIKLINVLDVVAYAEKFIEDIDWERMRASYPQVINGLKCLHFIHPLSAELKIKVGEVADCQLQGVGETMQSLTSILKRKRRVSEKLKLLLAPSPWWQHLYYNVAPENSLLWTRLIRHPINVGVWISKRLYSALLGG